MIKKKSFSAGRARLIRSPLVWLLFFRFDPSRLGGTTRGFPAFFFGQFLGTRSPTESSQSCRSLILSHCAIISTLKSSPVRSVTQSIENNANVALDNA